MVQIIFVRVGQELLFSYSKYSVLLKRQILIIQFHHKTRTTFRTIVTIVGVPKFAISATQNKRQKNIMEINLARSAVSLTARLTASVKREVRFCNSTFITLRSCGAQYDYASNLLA